MSVFGRPGKVRSPELYELLVIRRGWPAGRYGQFIAGALSSALLPAQGS